MSGRSSSEPFLLRWRACSWFVTFVVAFGISVDLLVYSVIIPVIPFQLETLGYTKVSALAGWLLFCYSGGLVIATIPITWFSEKYESRQWPLVLGLLILIGSQILYMFASHYAVMCVARILQGVGSSLVWVVGLALLSDSAPENLIGTQLGVATSAVSVGVTIGPPVGGVLYSHFGFRGPFIFGIIFTAVDLLFRLLVIERKVAVKWGYDPAARSISTDPKEEVTVGQNIKKETEKTESEGVADPASELVARNKSLSLVSAIRKLLENSRAMVCLFIIFVYGIFFASQEPVLPLHLNTIWHLDSSRIGITLLASVVPTFFSGVLSGLWADRSGTEWPTVTAMILSIPWSVLMIIERQLALFISVFALEAFFASAVLAPVMTELTSVGREIDGVGFGHVYGAFNIVYGIASGLGPVVGGQIYAHLSDGWMVLCLIATGCFVASSILAFFFIGKEPLYSRFRYLVQRRVGDR